MLAWFWEACVASPGCCTRLPCWTQMRAFASVDTPSQSCRYIHSPRAFGLSCLKCVQQSSLLLLCYDTICFGTSSCIQYAHYLQKHLPKAPGGSQPLPEGLLWLLLTGQMPSESQVAGLSKDLLARSEIPTHVHSMLKSLPKGTHPMTQFSIAIMALQSESLFARAYQDGAITFPPSKRPEINMLACAFNHHCTDTDSYHQHMS
jgi:hypothetical protein